MRKICTFILLVLTLFMSGTVAQAIQGRWYHASGEFKTYIQPNHKYSVMMKHGFQEWQRVTKQRFKFRFVTNDKTADFRVYFVKKIDKNRFSDLDRAIGVTRTMYRGKKIYKATIWIADRTQDNRTLSRDEVYTTMLHEIGHGLGLNHVNERDSIMYPQADVRLEISRRDLRTLAKMYRWY